MDIGTKGTITFGDGTTAKVVIIDKKEYPTMGMPTDYWLSYQEGETNRQLNHPDIKDKFPLPEGLLNQVFKSEQKMEDNENQDPIKNLLNSLGMSGNKSVPSDTLPEAYKDCDAIYRSQHNKLGLPIYVGVETKKSRFYVGFGDDTPFSLNKEEVIYMMTALTALVSKGFEEQLGKNHEDMQATVLAMNKEVSFSKGGKPVSSATDDLKQKLESDDAPEIPSEVMKEIENNLEEMKNMAEQVEEYTKAMTPEEKEAHIKELAKKHEDLLAKKAREFERELLGSIEEEESVTYNYDYFQNIHQKQGIEALKEELAKIPNKEERSEIIQKIIEEAKLKKQQKPANNNEKTD